jgi:glyoxylase-like metal-dependent hydrolase (beta-lactamase superfamily II)
MMRHFLLFAALMAFLMVAPCVAETVAGLPLHVQTIAPGVVRVWAGDHVSSTAVSAIATRKGIVVIDATELPALDQEFRKVIARELGRDDFRFLINTHGHGDHTNGNGVYADCQIIAEEQVPGMMRENFANHARQGTWRTEDIQRQKELIASEKSTPEQKAIAQERLVLNHLALECLKASPAPTFPTKTFTDQMVLDCGDVTLELYQAGGTHTRSDIFILVPQKGILFTGDMMADKWLTDTPGCLATFAARTGTLEDFPVLVRSWQAMLDRKDEIKLYVPGHWNGELSYEGFKNRFDYLQALLTDVAALVKSGGDFQQFATAYTLKSKFPQLVGSPGISDRGHLMSLQHLYVIDTGKILLAEAVQNLVRSADFSAGFAKLKADLLAARDKYFFSEFDINNLGYWLVELKQLDDALLLFELNRELYPNSWNAYDSLAEGYYRKGDKQKALDLYRKSLELNPNSENGKKYIATIEKERSPQN